SDSVLVEELKKRGTWKGESAEQLRINSRLKWDKRCRHAVLLRKEGMSYSKIAKQIGCHETNILKELKKRGYVGVPLLHIKHPISFWHFLLFVLYYTLPINH
ncbi:helix-turn-helix domain-containing protein, partial [Escherichia sp. R-CC3]